MLIDEGKYRWEKTEPLQPTEGGRRLEKCASFQEIITVSQGIANFTSIKGNLTVCFPFPAQEVLMNASTVVHGKYLLPQSQRLLKPDSSGRPHAGSSR